MLDLEELRRERERLGASTPRQRQALYRLGRSRHFVRRYGATSAAASRAIRAALAERDELERKR